MLSSLLPSFLPPIFNSSFCPSVLPSIHLQQLYLFFLLTVGLLSYWHSISSRPLLSCLYMSVFTSLSVCLSVSICLHVCLNCKSIQGETYTSSTCPMTKITCVSIYRQADRQADIPTNRDRQTGRQTESGRLVRRCRFNLKWSPDMFSLRYQRKRNRQRKANTQATNQVDRHIGKQAGR